MRKSLITMTIKVEAILPNNVSATEFTKLFPLNLPEYDGMIVEKVFESEEFLNNVSKD